MGKKKKGKYRIPSSRPEHFREAIVYAERFSTGLCSNHPVEEWLDKARTFTADLETGQLPGDPNKPLGEDPAMERYIEAVFLPACRLCRLSLSLKLVGRIGGTVEEEVQQAKADRNHFYHSEYVLYIATRLAKIAKCEVNVVRTMKGKRTGKTPDLEIPNQKFCIECVAHEEGKASRPLDSDFEHAAEKFEDYFTTRPGYTGVLGVDLGIVGSPSLPNIGRLGPHIPRATRNADDNFKKYTNVSAVLMTWESAEFVTEDTAHGHAGRMAAAGSSGIRYAPNVQNHIRALDSSFHVWIENPTEIALRDNP